jgi:hypothetical protein
LIAVLWRAGLRISEALALNETDIDIARGSLLVRHGKGDKRREAGMDPFGFEQLAAWLAHRVSLPVGPLFCVIDGPTRGRRWAATAARCELRELAAEAGVRRRFAPHQLRHAHAVELAREGVAVNIIQRQLGHTHPFGRSVLARSWLAPARASAAKRSPPPARARTSFRGEAFAYGSRDGNPVRHQRDHRAPASRRERTGRAPKVGGSGRATFGLWRNSDASVARSSRAWNCTDS